jgi:hypothetical protein
MLFKKLMRTEQGKLESCFESIATSGSMRFHLTVHPGSGELHHFKMSRHDSSLGNSLWKIINAPHPPE